MYLVTINIVYYDILFFGAYPPSTQLVSICSCNKAICNVIVYVSKLIINCCHQGILTQVVMVIIQVHKTSVLSTMHMFKL